MGKVLQFARAIVDLKEELIGPDEADSEIRAMKTGFEICNCENCGRKVNHLILSAEGFFHCDTCQFMHVRMTAVQGFDTD